MQSMPTESDVLSYNQSIENSVGRGARQPLMPNNIKLTIKKSIIKRK